MKDAIRLPKVEVFRTLEALNGFAAELKALNLASRRPSPFQTPEFFAAHRAHDEYENPKAEPLFLLAFEDAHLVGFLALRKADGKLEFFATHTNDRPLLVARKDDEARCARAFLKHLVEHERGWSFLELMEQDENSALFALELGPRFYVRRYPNNPNSTLTLSGRSFEQWFETVASNMKTVVAKSTRRIAREGKLEFLSCDDPRAAETMYAQYLELEGRSWKKQAKAGITRHPVRMELFKALIGPGQQTTPLFHWLLLDGVPIASTLCLKFHDTVWQMETTFDESWGYFMPGNILYLLGTRDLFVRGARRTDMLGNFSYYKSRWSSEVTPTFAVQVYKRPSVAWLRAVAGELKRKVKGEALQQKDAAFNLAKKAEPGEVVDREATRAIAGKMLAALEAMNASMVRLSDESLAQALPFSLESGPKKKEKKQKAALAAPPPAPPVAA